MQFKYSLIAVMVASLSVIETSAAQSVEYLQDFDNVIAPALPPGWSVPEGAWATSASVASPGSGGQNVENKGGSPGSLVSPVFDLSGISLGELRYSARRTSTYDSLNLVVEASTNGGGSWTVTLIDSTSSLPIPASTYDTISVSLPGTLTGQTAARIRFRTLSSTGGNLRLDDIHLIADGPLAWNRFGFAADGSSEPEDTDSVRVPIGIHLIPSSSNLQGLQFSVKLSAGLSFVSLDVGAAALTTANWQITHESTDSVVSVVVLSEGIGGLPPLVTDSLFILTVRTLPLGGAPMRVDMIEIVDVIASEASPTGEDLFLSVDPPVHMMTVVPRVSALRIDSTRANFGTIAQDSTAHVQVRLTNSGTATLNIFDMYSISGLLGIEPAFMTLMPDSSAFVTLSVNGSDYGVGPLDDWLVLDHDGSTSPDSIQVTGVVISADTRGDANGDGFVDVLDLVLGIDLILGRIDLPETGMRLDLHPFPAGNLSIDVRDLTVLAQAIARGVWPDGSPLPSSEAAVAKGGTVVGDLVVRQDESGVSLLVMSADRLRALHVVARSSAIEAPVVLSTDFPMIHLGRPYRNRTDGTFSIIAFGLEDPPILPDQRIQIARIEGVKAADVEIMSSVAIDESLRRRALTTILESEGPPTVLGTEVMPPYPNPIDPDHAALVHVPINSHEDLKVRLAVTDILGRTVRLWNGSVAEGKRVATWDLKDATGRVVPSGVYFISVETSALRRTHSLIVR